MKRLISILLSVVILLSACGVVNAGATDNGSTESKVSRLEKNKIYTSEDGKYKYKLAVYHTYGECLVDTNYVSRDSIQIIKYLGEKLTGTYTVPKEIDGCPVGEIGKEVFKNQNFKKVVFHKKIQQVNRKAFYSCQKLKTVVFKGSDNYEGINFIGKQAFADCSNLTKLRVNKRTDIIFRKKALYNCPKLKSFNIDSDCEIGSKSIGFYHDKNTGKDKRVKGLKVKLFGVSFSALANTESYLYNNNFIWTADITEEDGISGSYSEGYTFRVTYNGEKLSKIKSSNKKVVKVNSDGRLFCLKTGKSDLTFKLNDGTKKTFRLYVGYSGGSMDFVNLYPDVVYVDKKYNLRYFYDNDRGNTCPEYLPLKQGSVLKLPISGKVKSINNIYKSSNKAKIISSPSDDVLKIKGLKKGETAVKIRINGIKTIKIKLKIT